MQNPIIPVMKPQTVSPFTLGNIPRPPQMQVRTATVKVAPTVTDTPPADIAPVDVAPAPAPSTASDAGAVSSDIITVPEGKFKINGAGDYSFIDDSGDETKVDAIHVPMAVASAAAKKYPAPGEIVSGGKRYKVVGKKLETYLDKLGVWGTVPDGRADSLPEDVKKMLYEAKGTGDKERYQEVMSHPYFGNNAASKEQVEAQKQEILKTQQALTENQTSNNDIDTPERLEQERTSVAAQLAEATKSGDKAQVATLQRKQKDLADTHIMATPDGGYIKWVKDPVGDSYSRITVTPKEPKHSGEYDYTKDPIQMDAAARTRAEIENRKELSEESGQVIMNDSSNRIVRDFVGNYAKWYRQQQLTGNHPSSALPELLAQKLSQQMNGADPDGAIQTIGEMQQALADVYGSGYMALRPDYSKPTTYNNGRTDNLSTNVPRAPEHGWTVQSQTITQPKVPAAEKREVNLILPNVMGNSARGDDAQNSVVSAVGADEANTRRILSEHAAILYQRPDAQIPDYVTPRGKRAGKTADRATAFDQHVQERIMDDPIFKNAMIGGVLQGVEAAAAQAELAHANKIVSQSTSGDAGADAEDLKKSERIKPGTSDEVYNETMKKMFGSEKPPPLWYDKRGNPHAGKDDLPKEKLTPVYGKWSDAGAVKTYIEKFRAMPEAEQKLEVAKSGLAKTIYILDGVASGRNGRIEIDSRLQETAHSQILKSLGAILSPEATAFIQNNRGYFENNVIKESGNAKVNGEELVRAVNNDIWTNAIMKMMGQTLGK